jgi:hypothetical protein
MGCDPAAVHYWRYSTIAVRAWLDVATEADIDEPRPNHLGPNLPARHIVGILLDE